MSRAIGPALGLILAVLVLAVGLTTVAAAFALVGTIPAVMNAAVLLSGLATTTVGVILAAIWVPA